MADICYFMPPPLVYLILYGGNVCRLIVSQTEKFVRAYVAMKAFLTSSQITQVKTALLDRLSILSLPRKETFVVAEAFKLGSQIGGRVLSSIGWNFSKHFLGVIEHPVRETQITVWTLLRTAGDKWILETLEGQPDGGTCSLANIHGLMTLGEKASNHLDGQSNFAYVSSPANRQLWAVHWLASGTNEWIIGSVQVPHPDIDWRDGSRLFASRNIG